jgi:hypothetical protein
MTLLHGVGKFGVKSNHKVSESFGKLRETPAGKPSGKNHLYEAEISFLFLDKP